MGGHGRLSTLILRPTSLSRLRSPPSSSSTHGGKYRSAGSVLLTPFPGSRGSRRPVLGFCQHLETQIRLMSRNWAEICVNSPFVASVSLEQDSEQEAAASIPPHHSHLCPANRVVALTWSRGRGLCPSAFSNHVPEQTVTQLSKLRPRPGPAQPGPSPWPSAGPGPAHSHLFIIASISRGAGGGGVGRWAPGGQEPVCRRRWHLYPSVCCPPTEQQPREPWTQRVAIAAPTGALF